MNLRLSATPRRPPQLPRAPTFDEAGVAGYTADAWQGVQAPPGSRTKSRSITTWPTSRA